MIGAKKIAVTLGVTPVIATRLACSVTTLLALVSIQPAFAQTLSDPKPDVAVNDELSHSPPTSAEIEPTSLATEVATEPPLPVAEPTGPQVYTSPDQENREVSPYERRYHYRITVDARVAYDDNITLSPIAPIDDIYGRIGAALTFGFGVPGSEANYFGVSYSPSYSFYSSRSNFNTLDHIAHLEGQHRFSRLRLTAAGDLQSTQTSHLESSGTNGSVINSANLDAGGRRRITSYSTHANAAYDLTGKTSLSLGGSFAATDYSNLISSRSIAGNIAIDYKYDPKLSFGLVGSAGRNLVDAPTPNQTFEQINGRMNYEATGKISMNASGGIEFRNFENGTDGRISPVFQLGLTYAPFDGTSFNLSGSRTTLNSATLAGQDFASTQITATVKQRFLRRFSLGLSTGYQNLTYFNTVNGEDTSRSDNYYFIQPSIDATVTRYCSAGVYYLHRRNDSSFNLFGFDENQFGVHSSISF